MAKKKGGGRGDDDDEHDEVEAAAAGQPAGGKGKKKGKRGKGRDDFDDDFKVEPEEGQEGHVADEGDANESVEGSAKGAVPAKSAAGGKKKKGKKGRGNDDSDDDFAVQPEEEETEPAGAKQGKKGKKGKKGRGDDDFDEDFKVDIEDDASEVASEAPSAGGAVPKGRGKKKDKKKGRRAGDWSDEDEEEVAPAKKEAPPAKAKAGAKKAASTFALLNIDDEDEEDEEEEEIQKPAANGKAKGGAGKKAVSFAALQDEESDEEEEEAPKPSKKLNGFAGLSLEDTEDDAEPCLVVGEIESVEKIKKADKLRLCHVNVGSDEPLQIVCGGKNVREGLKVIVARVGSRIPSSGMLIQKTTIKGVESYGMICGAAEMGWEGPADEAIELGDEAAVGEKASPTRPLREEEDEEAVSFSGLKKKVAPKVGEMEQGSHEELVFAGKKKKKGGKPAPVVEDEESEEEAPVFAGKKKKGKKEAPKPVADEKNGEDEEESAVFAGKKKKKGKKAPSDDFDKDFEVEPEVPAEEEEDEGVVFAGKKKKKGKKAQHDFDKDFEADAVEPAEEEDSEAVVFAGKKKKKGKKAAQDDFDKDFEMEDSAGAPEPAPVAAPEPMVVEKKGKKGKDKKEDEDIEALLAQLEAPKKEDEEGAGSKKKKKKGKKGKDEKEEEDIDAILAELEGPKKEEAQPAPGVAPAPAVEETGPSKAEEAELSAAAAGEGEEKEGDEGLSAAAKKKKKKKEKEKEKKSADKAAVVEDEGAKEEEAKKKKAAADKKLPLHVRQMQERLAKLQAEEERKKKEEEERRRKEEEEAARLAELERQKEEAKLRKKQKEKEKREQLKKEGKLLTGKQKEEAKRLAAVREQMLKQAGVKLDGDEAAPKKQKVVYGTKKSRQPSKQAAEAAPKEVSPEPVPAPEPEPMEEEAPEPVQEEVPAEKVPEPPAEEEESEEEDWDAKSWDEAEVDKTLKKTGAFRDEEEHDTPARVASPKPAKKEEAKPAKKDEPAKPAASRPAILHKAGPRKQPAEESSSDEEDSETESEEESSEDEVDERRRAEARKRREARMKEAMAKRDENDLRSPICCILGHVDTGKTKLLDRIRNTNVQEGEAGGITQQIGATFFPMDAIKERTKELKSDATLKVPGLLIIDTPGHESFTNLRSRGSGLCDIAILVVDIMHGLEPQTVESINLLKMRKTPFIIALNKVDRLYDWKVQSNAPIRNALKIQPEHVRKEFDQRAAEAIGMLQEQGLNSALYWKNNDPRRVISIVPTSAISGEGIPDMLLLLVQMTQKMMSEKLMFLSETQCTVLEVKVIEGLGTTIDVVLVNGVLHEGDTIVVCGLQGPIKTSIRALLTPHPMKELRVKGSYVHHKELKAAQGIKITAQGLESAVAGTQLYVVGPDDDVDDVMDEAMQDMNSILSRVDKSGEGVCVQASTLGSLEALLEFLKSPDVNIPVSGINIGPVHKKDVMRASVMLERKRKEFACILAFDVKVTPEARDMAEELGVKVFTADIIYHLFDQFTAYMGNIKAEKRAEAAEDAVFPCILKILPQFVFMKKDPIILGCDVVAGIAKVGTPICVPSKGTIDIGKIASIEMNHKAVDTAKKGQSIALKIQSTNAEEAQKMYGRHFDKDDELVSHISRKSIDLLKENYRDDLTRDDWMLVVKLKKMFEIQ